MRLISRRCKLMYFVLDAAFSFCFVLGFLFDSFRRLHGIKKCSLFSTTQCRSAWNSNANLCDKNTEKSCSSCCKMSKTPALFRVSLTLSLHAKGHDMLNLRQFPFVLFSSLWFSSFLGCRPLFSSDSQSSEAVVYNFLKWKKQEKSLVSKCSIIL